MQACNQNKRLPHTKMLAKHWSDPQSTAWTVEMHVRVGGQMSQQKLSMHEWIVACKAFSERLLQQITTEYQNLPSLSSAVPLSQGV